MSTPTSAAPSPLPAAVYVRISKDRAGGGLGVERQEADCRAHAASLGWDVVEVFTDNDISAHSGVTRPAYRAMLDAVRAGRVRGVVAWHTDRLHRRTLELEEFVTLAEGTDLAVQTVRSGSVDLSTASGRMVARMLGAAAQHEVDHAIERMKRAKQQLAADGKYRGGKRPYGYERDGMTVREAEAEVVRRATREVLAGRSLRAVCRELNAEGLRTGTGKEWAPVLLRDVLLRARNAGLIAHGTANRAGFKVVGPAQWPALVDEDTWRALVALVTHPGRRTNNTSSDNRWLGSYLFRCGRCGAPMRVDSTAGPGSNRPNQAKRHHYRCTAAAHLQITQERTDAHVREVVAELLRDPRIIAGLTPSADGEAVSADHERRSALAARLEGFEGDYAAGHITGAQLAKATAAVEAEMADVDARLAAHVSRSASSPVLAAPDPGAAFLDAPIDVQRAVLAAVLRVEVLPATKRGVWWSPDRLRIAPVTAEG